MMNGFFELYDAGEVRRYHTMRVVHDQSVGEHSWGVAFIIQWLYEPAPPSGALMCAAINHDLAERRTGDMPATAKWDNPTLAEALIDAEDKYGRETGLPQHKLTPDEDLILHYADMAELVAYCITECRMGNWRMHVIAERGLKRMADMRTSGQAVMRLELRNNMMRLNDLLTEAWRMAQ
jgi:hypothetical protein